MEGFTKAEYHLIHGTNDDNVHFQSAAQMEKALVAHGIDFDNFVSQIIIFLLNFRLFQFYADEDHSVRSTPTVQQHNYRNIITRIIQSWGYQWNGGDL